MIYFTSDIHFYDDRFDILFRNFKSIEEYHKTIINNWNKVVRDDDIVYCLGDIVYKSPDISILNELSGTKYLVKGNHDILDDNEYLTYFKDVYNGISIKITKTNDIYNLNHYPTRGVIDQWNLCGHIHGSWRVQKNMINVSVDCWDFTPVSYKQIEAAKNFIENYADDDCWAAYDPINTEHIERGVPGTYWGK